MKSENFKRKYIRVSKEKIGYNLEYNFLLPNMKNSFIFGNYSAKSKEELLSKITKVMSYLKNSGISEVYLKSGKKLKYKKLSPIESNLLKEISQQIKNSNENMIVKKRITK